MAAAAAATPVLPPCTTAVAMKMPVAGSGVSLAAAPWREARPQCGRGGVGGSSGSSLAAWQQWWWRAARQQCNAGGHGHDNCRHRRPATARRCGGNEDTGSKSDGGGTNNQQTTKISNITGNENSDNDSDDNDNRNEGKGNGGGSAVAVWGRRPAWWRQLQQTAAAWQERGVGSGGQLGATESREGNVEALAPAASLARDATSLLAEVAAWQECGVGSGSSAATV